MTKYDAGKCVMVTVSKEGYFPKVDVVAMNEDHNLTFNLVENPTHKLDYDAGDKTAEVNSSVEGATITLTEESTDVYGLDLENVESGSTIIFTIADDTSLLTNRESYIINK